MNKTIDVVGAVIVNELGEILCARRAEHMKLAGYWEFPGGKIESGESYDQALMREIREEMGVSIEVGSLVADIVHAYEQVQVHLITFFARITSGVMSSTDHDELRWVAVAHLRELEWAPADWPTVDRLQEMGVNHIRI